MRESSGSFGGRDASEPGESIGSGAVVAGKQLKTSQIDARLRRVRSLHPSGEFLSGPGMISGSRERDRVFVSGIGIVGIEVEKGAIAGRGLFEIRLGELSAGQGLEGAAVFRFQLDGARSELDGVVIVTGIEGGARALGDKNILDGQGLKAARQRVP